MCPLVDTYTLMGPPFLYTFCSILTGVGPTGGHTFLKHFLSAENIQYRNAHPRLVLKHLKISTRSDWTTSILSCKILSLCHFTFEPQHEISNNVVCATSKASDQPAHTHSLIRAFASRLNILGMLSYRLNIIWSF